MAAIFYAIVRQFGRKKGNGFETSKLSKETTAIIAVLIVLIAGIITVIALVLYAPSKQNVNASNIDELLDLLNDRHAHGAEIFSTLAKSPSLSEDSKFKIRQVSDRYTELTGKAKDALKKNQLTRYHEATKDLLEYIESREVKETIPTPQLDDLKYKAAWDPKMDQVTRILNETG